MNWQNEEKFTLHKKWSFSLKIYSVHLLNKSLTENFLVSADGKFDNFEKDRQYSLL